MEIKIYSKDRGLHNPYSKEINPFHFTVASFLIDCVFRTCNFYQATPDQLFISKRGADPIPMIRGMLMVSCYQILKPIDARFTSTLVANAFRHDRCSISNYAREIREKYPYPLSFYTVIQPKVASIAQTYFPDGVILSTDKQYTIEDLHKLAASLGGTKADVQRFLQTRA